MNDTDPLSITLTRKEWKELTTKLREFNQANPDRQLQLGRLPWLIIGKIEFEWQSTFFASTPESPEPAGRNSETRMYPAPGLYDRRTRTGW